MTARALMLLLGLLAVPGGCTLNGQPDEPRSDEDAAPMGPGVPGNMGVGALDPSALPTAAPGGTAGPVPTDPNTAPPGVALPPDGPMPLPVDTPPEDSPEPDVPDAGLARELDAGENQEGDSP